MSEVDVDYPTLTKTITRAITKAITKTITITIMINISEGKCKLSYTQFKLDISRV